MFSLQLIIALSQPPSERIKRQCMKRQATSGTRMCRRSRRCAGVSMTTVSNVHYLAFHCQVLLHSIRRCHHRAFFITKNATQFPCTCSSEQSDGDVTASVTTRPIGFAQAVRIHEQQASRHSRHDAHKANGAELTPLRFNEVKTTTQVTL